MAPMFDRRIIEYLRDWKDKPSRKPLVVRGARQVGKTSAILIFGKSYFKEIVHLNLEKNEHLRWFKKALSLQDLLNILQVNWKAKLIPGETLIFIDEIQNAPNLIQLLRFFYEDRPDLHVIAAGSLLEAKIEKEGFSFPVGRVEFCYLYPLDFFEYLKAKGEDKLLTLLRGTTLTNPLPAPIHDAALKLFYEYCMVGGMPGVIKEYLENQNINKLLGLYGSLLTAYIEDVHKYASQAEAKYLGHIIETAPLFAGTTITYEKFGGSNYRSREISKAFSLLEKVMLLTQIRATSSLGIPIIAKEKRPKKLIYLDVGLVNFRMNILTAFMQMTDFDGLYQGRIAEQVVAQNILASFTSYPAQLYYWARERQKGSAEVDFCLNHQGKTLGLEVKAGKKGRLKSLQVFAQQVEAPLLARCYSGELKKEKFPIDDKHQSLMSIPFYLVPRIFDLLS